MNFIKTKSFQLATYSKGNKNSKKLALVLPGKLDTKDYAHMKSHVDFLSSKGFYALSFDPPGTWESKGDISLYNTTNYLKAVDELIGYFGNKQTFILGHSRGASVSMIAGARNKHISGYAAFMPSFSEQGFDKTKDEQWKKLGYKISMRDLPPGGEEEVKEFKLPYNFYKDQIKYEMTDEFKNSEKPKLIIVGKHDITVPYDSVIELYNLVSEPKRLYEIDSDHNYRLVPKLIEEVNMVLGKFIKDYHV